MKFGELHRDSCLKKRKEIVQHCARRSAQDRHGRSKLRVFVQPLLRVELDTLDVLLLCRLVSVVIDNAVAADLCMNLFARAVAERPAMRLTWSNQMWLAREREREREREYSEWLHFFQLQREIRGAHGGALHLALPSPLPDVATT